MKEVMNFGTLIRFLREEQNLTQVELAKFLLIDNTTLSKIENNVDEPSSSVFETIMEYFGLSPKETYEYWIMAKSVKVYTAIRALENRMSEGDYTEAEDIILKLENTKHFKNRLALQYLLGTKASVWIEKGIESTKIVGLLREALSITRNPFEESEIGKYRLSYREISSIIRLAVAYWNLAEKERGIKILLSLKESIEKSYISKQERMRSLPKIYCNLISWLGQESDYENALGLCKEAKELFVKYDTLTFLADIYWSWGNILAYQDKKEQCNEILTYAYYQYISTNRESEANRLKLDSKEDFGYIIPYCPNCN